MLINRRSFLKAGSLLVAAPAICRAEWLMPVKPCLRPIPFKYVWVSLGYSEPQLIGAEKSLFIGDFVCINNGICTSIDDHSNSLIAGVVIGNEEDWPIA